jgi:hypothetical protein
MSVIYSVDDDGDITLFSNKEKAYEYYNELKQEFIEWKEEEPYSEYTFSNGESIEHDEGYAKRPRCVQITWQTVL